MSSAPITQCKADPAAVSVLKALVADHGAELVAQFYDVLMRDPEASAFLNHATVHGRLSSSMLDWLISLLGDDEICTSPALQEKQRIVGKVHARIKIPIHLVMEGAIVIKQKIHCLLRGQGHDAATILAVAEIVASRIDRAILLMSQSYVKDTADGARLDEAYRLFTLDQDLSTEKETQRAAMLEWSRNALFALLRGEQLDRLSSSEFGFWVRHRAEFMFQNSPQFRTLVEEIEKIDDTLLPHLQTGTDEYRANNLSAFQESIDRITFLVTELFQTLGSMEVGRDPLTRALNRRFLPAILSREISYANNNDVPLTVMMVDIDHFKSINDHHGHQAGDAALRQVAEVLIDNVRASDFIFRFGGEEFLIVSAETDLETATQMAERIRKSIEFTKLDIGAPQPVFATVSIGIAQHGGHPDHSYLTKRADGALYHAKSNGRNRIVVAN